MKNKLFKILFIFIFTNLFFLNFSYSEIISRIQIIGNDRISDETIKMFSDVKLDEDINNNKLNLILKNLYETNFFENVSLNLNNNVLVIEVKENPIIQKIEIKGIKANKIKEVISKVTTLKSRSSFNDLILKKDLENIKIALKELGYFFPIINTFQEKLDSNKINLTYQIDLGKKAKIKRISFIGDKKFKDKKLKSIIISEENKFWKFITNKKFVNQNVISLDMRLLRNFYLNRGYFNVMIESSFAKLLNETDFELIYNIQANEKYYFNDLKIELPNDFEKENFEQIYSLFNELKGQPYSIDQIENILRN